MRYLTPSVRLSGVLKTMASPRLMVVFFLLMAGAALAAAHNPEYVTVIVLLPMLLLLLNLSAAILSNARFRADLPLLLFHLALLAFLALLLVARLTYFDGGVKLSAGALFNGDYLSVQQGWLHGNGAKSLRFANDGLTEYAKPGGLPTTYNRVRWWDSAGMPHMAEIGNDRPLVMNGYRIYATNLRGFEPIFHWQPKNGTKEIGAVQLPYTFLGDFPAGSRVILPVEGEAWVQLTSAESFDLQGKRDDLGVQTLKHKLILRVQGTRYELQPGQSVDLPGGHLTYAELGTWMGYRVTYDPTPPWLAASVFFGVISLMWFYARLWRRPHQSINVI